MAARMRKPLLFILVLATLVIAAVQARDALARYVWQQRDSAALALLLNSNDPKLFVQLGHHYFGGQRTYGASLEDREYDLRRAGFAYEAAATIDPTLPGIHYNLARLRFAEGNMHGALVEIEKELAAHPENLRSLYIRGLIYGFRQFPGDLKRAERDFRAFTEWAYTEWAGYNDLMWVLLEQEKYAEAEAVGHKAVVMAFGGSENPWLWNSLGVAQLNQGKLLEAEKSFARASETAAQLTEEEWRKAYTGNHPMSAREGLADFRQGIEQNFHKVAEGLGKI